MKRRKIPDFDDDPEKYIRNNLDEFAADLQEIKDRLEALEEDVSRLIRGDFDEDEEEDFFDEEEED